LLQHHLFQLGDLGQQVSAGGITAAVVATIPGLHGLGRGGSRGWIGPTAIFGRQIGKELHVGIIGILGGIALLLLRRGAEPVGGEERVALGIVLEELQVVPGRGDAAVTVCGIFA